jgi:hypothetical protein
MSEVAWTLVSVATWMIVGVALAWILWMAAREDLGDWRAEAEKRERRFESWKSAPAAGDGDFAAAGEEVIGGR